MTKSTLSTQISTAVLTGGRRTTAAAVRTLLNAIVDESFNMADPTASALIGTEKVALIQGGVSKTIDLNTIAAFIGGGGGSQDLEAVLSVGNTTGNQPIYSPDTNTGLRIYDGYGLFAYQTGAIISEVDISDSSTSIYYTNGTAEGYINIGTSEMYVYHNLAMNFESPQYNFALNADVSANTYAYFNGTGRLISGATPGAVGLATVLGVSGSTGNLGISSPGTYSGLGITDSYWIASNTDGSTYSNNLTMDGNGILLDTTKPTVLRNWDTSTYQARIQTQTLFSEVFYGADPGGLFNNGGSYKVTEFLSTLKHSVVINFDAPTYNITNIAHGSYMYVDGSGNIVAGTPPLTSAPNLATVLGVGNSTGGTAMQSPNTKSKLLLSNFGGALSYYNGTETTNVQAYSGIANMTYDDGGGNTSSISIANTGFTITTVTGGVVGLDDGTNLSYSSYTPVQSRILYNNTINGGGVAITDGLNYIDHTQGITFDSPVYNFAQATPNTYAYFDASANLIGAGAPPLATVLAAGGSTGGLSITSPDTLSTLNIFDGQVIMGYYSTMSAEVYADTTGAGLDWTDGSSHGGSVIITAPNVSVTHSALVVLDAPSVILNQEILKDSSGNYTMQMGSGGGLWQLGYLNGGTSSFVYGDFGGTYNFFSNGTITSDTASIVSKWRARWISGTQSASIQMDNASTSINHTVALILNSPVYTFSQLTASTVPYLDASKNLVSSSVTPTELGYVSGTTSNLQAQINALTSGLSWKAAVRALAASNITLSGAQTIDGVSVIAGDRVLVIAQSFSKDNGIYVCASGAWARATDADTGAKILQATCGIEEGTTYHDKQYVCTTDAPIIIGTTPLSFVSIGGTTYVGTTNRITVTGNVIDIDAAYIGQSSITTLGTVTTGVWNSTKVAEVYGGTNQNAYVTGDTLYASASNTLSRLSIGSSAQMLIVNAGVPTWQTLSLNATGGAFALSNTGVITFPNADTSTRGLLLAADWTTFNNKFLLPSLTTGSVLFSNGTTITQDANNFYFASHLLSVNVNGDTGGTDSINTYKQIDSFTINNSDNGYTSSHARGAVGAFTESLANDYIGVFGFFPYNGSAWTEAASIRSYVKGSTSTNRGADLEFYTKKDAGALTLAMTIDNVQNVTFANHIIVEGVTSTGATGTGKIVFDTSPTLSNPIVGTQTRGNNSTIAASTAFVQDAVGTLVYLTSGDQTTTSSSAGNITELVFNASTVGKRYYIEGVVHIGCNNTGGVKLAITIPTGATMSVAIFGPNIPNSSNANTQTLSSSGTLQTTAYNTSNSALGMVFIKGEILLDGIHTGNIQMQFASGTNTQTSTIFQQGTVLKIIQYP